MIFQSKMLRYFSKGVVGEEKEMKNSSLVAFLANHPCHHMTIQEIEAFSKKNNPQQLEIDFIGGINRNSKNIFEARSKRY